MEKINYDFKGIIISPSFAYYGAHSDTHSSNYSTILVKERSIVNLNLEYNNFHLGVKNIFDDHKALKIHVLTIINFKPIFRNNFLL